MQSTYSYSNTAEYRELLRSLCRMNGNAYYSDDNVNVYMSNAGDVDEETLDEYHYDEVAVSLFLDAVYRRSKDVPAFQTLYSAAAGLMLCEDPEIGLSILCSYDYLCLFYSVYRRFELFNAAATTETVDAEFFVSMSEYSQLLQRLTKKN